MLKAITIGLSLGIFLMIDIDSSYSITTTPNFHVEDENSSPQAVINISFANDDTTIAQTQEIEEISIINQSVPPVRQSARASWYRHGRITANGERFDPNGLTVAHKSLPFGTLVRFINPENGLSIIARVNDRGPFIRNRSFDLSFRSAQLLGFHEKGVVRLEYHIVD